MSEEIIPATSMRWSEEISALVGAMATAQGAIRNAVKDSMNPHLKSKYADLANVWEACRAELSKNGIAVIQSPAMDGPRVVVTTLLAHKSGEWVRGELALTPQQNTPQGVGSAITYARRYALSAMVGVAPDDDDGNEASLGSKRRRQAEESVDEITEIVARAEAKREENKSLPMPAAPQVDAEGKPKVVKAKKADDWYATMLKGMSGIKAELGDEAYYRILGANGFTHANEIPNRDAATAIYREMKAELNDRKLTEQQPKSAFETFMEQPAGA